MRIEYSGYGTAAAVWIAVCVAVLLTPPALGDVVDAVWIDPANYRYEIKHMPDLDQQRVPAPGVWGLPNNGKQYCVPTSTMNMIMYIANHGHPQFVPGPDNWQATETYNEASVSILALGLKMGTGATTGTTAGGWLSGASAWSHVVLWVNGAVREFTVGWRRRVFATTWRRCAWPCHPHIKV